MDQALVGPIVGSVTSAVLLIVITGMTGIVRSVLALVRDVAVMRVELTALSGRINTLDHMSRTGLRVMESRAGEEFLDPNPITPREADIIRRAQREGAHTLSDDELLDGILALDREWEEGHIPQTKKGAATRLLSAWNQELKRREEEDRAARTLQETHVQKPSWLRIIWPFRWPFR